MNLDNTGADIIASLRKTLFDLVGQLDGKNVSVLPDTVVVRGSGTITFFDIREDRLRMTRYGADAWTKLVHEAVEHDDFEPFFQPAPPARI
jgi:hypothetical protein